MLKFFKNSETDEKDEARQLFEKVVGNRNDSRELRSARIRLGLLLRAHIDKTFVAGAEQTASHQELVALAIVNGQDRPPLPEANEFQQVKSGDRNIWVYLPMEYAEQVFALGVRYQRTEIDARQAIDAVQAVMDMICRFELKLDEPFKALQFLREELLSGAHGDAEVDSGQAFENRAD